jgi:hypothetical protein
MNDHLDQRRYFHEIDSLDEALIELRSVATSLGYTERDLAARESVFLDAVSWAMHHVSRPAHAADVSSDELARSIAAAVTHEVATLMRQAAEAQLSRARQRTTA